MWAGAASGNPALLRCLCGGFRFSLSSVGAAFFLLSADRQCTIYYPRYPHTFCPRKRGRAQKRVSQQLIAMCPVQAVSRGRRRLFSHKKRCNVFIRAAQARFCVRAEFHGNQIKRPCPFQSARSEFERKLASAPSTSQTKLFHARTEALARNAHFAKVIARKSICNCRCFSILPSAQWILLNNWKLWGLHLIGLSRGIPQIYLFATANCAASPALCTIDGFMDIKWFW
jgi:hypothetical protein